MSQLQVNRINDASGGVLAPISSVMRNRIINGAMTIDQRNAGASAAFVTGFTLDRWQGVEDTDGAMTAQQVTDAPAGFTNSLKVTTTTADASLGATQYADINQPIEGYNVADLAWGTAGAKTITISFWVKSSLTGTFGGCLTNSAFNRSYPFTYTISSANTWEQKSVTIAGDTGGTWQTTTSTGIRVIFGLGVGSTYSGTAGSWTANNFLSATGAVSVIGTLNATWQITGVQLEVGTQATSFEYRQYQQELALCQRYYEIYPSRAYRNADGTVISGNSILGYMVNVAIGFSGQTGTSTSLSATFKVEKRATPTVTFSTRGSAFTNIVETRGGGIVYSTIDTTTSGVATSAQQLAGGVDNYLAYGFEASSEL